MPLFGVVTIDNSLPSEYRDGVEKALNEMVDARKDVDVSFSSFSLLDGDLASFEISVNGKVLSAKVPIEVMISEIKNILLYEEELFSEEPRIDYMTNGSFSSLGNYWKKGNLLVAKDRKNKSRGVFVVSDKYEDAVQLEAIYLSSPLTGLPLEKKTGLLLTTSMCYLPSLRTFGAQLDSSFYTPLYPLLPTLSLSYDHGIKTSPFRIGVGGKVIFNLSSVYPSVPVIKNVSFGGGVSLYFSIPDFKVSGSWSLGVMFMVNGSLSLGISYTEDSRVKSRVAASIGVLI